MKKQTELTPWFSPSVKPARNGWYQRNWGKNTENLDNDYWDGLTWRYGEGTEYYGPAPNFRKWRGLASDPKVKK